MMSDTTPEQVTPTPAPASRRRRILIILSGLLVLAAGAGGLWWVLDGRYHETTDDAYVAGDIVQITPLIDLDPADARVALEQAEAALAQTVREVRTLYATNGSLGAVVAQRQADLAKAGDDLRRRQALTGTGAVSGEEIEHARTSVLA